MNFSHSYAGFTRKSFGTPSYPSPLDRIRTGKGDRAAQLGLTPVSSCRTRNKCTKLGGMLLSQQKSTDWIFAQWTAKRSRAFHTLRHSNAQIRDDKQRETTFEPRKVWPCGFGLQCQFTTKHSSLWRHRIGVETCHSRKHIYHGERMPLSQGASILLRFPEKKKKKKNFRCFPPSCLLTSRWFLTLQHGRRESYEANQSFPKLPKTHRAEEIDPSPSPPGKNILTLDDFKGNTSRTSHKEPKMKRRGSKAAGRAKKC